MPNAISAAQRESMGAGSGLLFDSSGNVVDATALLQGIGTAIGAVAAVAGPFVLVGTPSVTDEIDTLGSRNHTFQVLVTLNGGTSVTVRFEGSLTGEDDDWFNLDDTGNDTTYTADGCYQAHKGNFVCPWVRVQFVSRVGANAQIEARYEGR